MQRYFKAGTYKAQFSGITTAKAGRVRLRFLVWNDEEQDAEVFATNQDWPEGTAFAKMFLETFGTSPAGLKGEGFTVKLGDNLWKGRNYSTILCYERDSSFVIPQWGRDYMEAWQGDCELKAQYIASRMATDYKYRVGTEVRRATWDSLILWKDNVELLGCSSVELRRHIERQFHSGMNWTNYAELWEVDHIAALSRFDLTKPEEVKLAANFLNLRPCLVAENREKFNAPLEAAA